MEFKVGELLAVNARLRVFRVKGKVQEQTLFLAPGEKVFIVDTRVTKARGTSNHGARHLWYVVMSSLGIVEAGEATPEGFRARVERMV